MGRSLHGVTTETGDVVDDVEGNPRDLTLHNPRSLAGIHRLTELEELYLLSNTTPEGLEELARLPRLRQLAWREDIHTASREGRWRIDVSGLAGCKGLKALTLVHPQIDNLDSICDMQWLERLQVKGRGQGKRLSRLANLTNLTVLYGHCETLGGIQAIGQLDSLRELSLHGVSSASDLTLLRALTRLQKLVISGVRDAHIDLPYLSQLERFKVNTGFFPCDPTTFACLPSLKWLELNHWNAGDYTALAGAERLTKLAISQSDASTTKGLERCTGLTVLDLPLPPDCCDLSWLSAMPLLTSLKLEEAHAIRSLAVIGTLPLLTEMHLWDTTSLTTLNDLPAHSQLANLTLNGATSLATLEGFHRLSGLQELTVSGLTDVVDVTPLVRLPKLAEVGLHVEHDSLSELFMGSAHSYVATEAYDALVDCPALVDVRLDSATRSTEIEAVLAARRKDSRFILRHIHQWIEEMLQSPQPARTIPILLKAVVEVLDEDEVPYELEQIKSHLRQWQDAVSAAKEILGEL